MAATRSDEPPAAVFVVGCPRSGTNFLGSALGSLPGYVDAGELLRKVIPDLVNTAVLPAGRVLRAGLAARGFDLAPGSVRPVVHRPELVFLVPALQAMDVEVAVIHLVRDVRDVVSSLLSLGWLSTQPTDTDRPKEEIWGTAQRFWTEESRADEFSTVSDARRAAWAWRRYVGAGLQYVRDGSRTLTLRYEEMCTRRESAAALLASLVRTQTTLVDEHLDGISSASIGRWMRDLSPVHLQDISREAGELSRSLDSVLHST